MLCPCGTRSSLLTFALLRIIQSIILQEPTSVRVATWSYWFVTWQILDKLFNGHVHWLLLLTLYRSIIDQVRVGNVDSWLRFWLLFNLLLRVLFKLINFVTIFFCLQSLKRRCFSWFSWLNWLTWVVCALIFIFFIQNLYLVHLGCFSKNSLKLSLHFYLLSLFLTALIFQSLIVKWTTSHYCFPLHYTSTCLILIVFEVSVITTNLITLQLSRSLSSRCRRWLSFIKRLSSYSRLSRYHISLWWQHLRMMWAHYIYWCS